MNVLVKIRKKQNGGVKIAQAASLIKKESLCR